MMLAGRSKQKAIMGLFGSTELWKNCCEMWAMEKLMWAMHCEKDMLFGWNNYEAYPFLSLAWKSCKRLSVSNHLGKQKAESQK
jgi:hypothetical protein